VRRKLVCPLPEVTVAAFEVRLRHDRYAQTKFDRVVVRLYCLIYSINTEKKQQKQRILRDTSHFLSCTVLRVDLHRVRVWQVAPISGSGVAMDEFLYCLLGFARTIL